MNKLLLFLFRRKYKKRLLDAARDIALGKQAFMCLAIGKLKDRLPLFNQKEFKIFISKRYPELLPYVEERESEYLPWIKYPLEKSKYREFKFLVAWAKSEYLEWIAYNL